MPSTNPSRHALPQRARPQLSALGAATLAAAALLGSAQGASAQAFECPSFGDTCEVNADEMRLEFAGIGASNDVVVLGKLDWLIYHNLVACVNGVVQFGTDPNGLVRAHLDALL